MTLTDRLRAYAAKYGPADPEHQMCMEAAAEIARLAADQRDAVTESEANSIMKTGLGRLREQDGARETWQGDSLYIAGAKAGYNLGLIEDQDGLQQLINSRMP